MKTIKKTRKLFKPTKPFVEGFPYNPIYLLCMQNDELCMRCIVLEDNRNSRSIYCMSIYCMIKSGFRYAVLRAVSSLILFYSYFHFSLFFSIFLCSSPSFYPGFLRIFFFLAAMDNSNLLYTSALPVSLLHH